MSATRVLSKYSENVEMISLPSRMQIMLTKGLGAVIFYDASKFKVFHEKKNQLKMNYVKYNIGKICISLNKLL